MPESVEEVSYWVFQFKFKNCLMWTQIIIPAHIISILKRVNYNISDPNYSIIISKIRP